MTHSLLDFERVSVSFETSSNSDMPHALVVLFMLVIFFFDLYIKMFQFFYKESSFSKKNTPGNIQWMQSNITY